MDEIDDLMLTTSEVRKIEALCTRYEHLDSVTKALQSDNVKIVKESPILLDSLYFLIQLFFDRKRNNSSSVLSYNKLIGMVVVEKKLLSKNYYN